MQVVPKRRRFPNAVNAFASSKLRGHTFLTNRNSTRPQGPRYSAEEGTSVRQKRSEQPTGVEVARGEIACGEVTGGEIKGGEIKGGEATESGRRATTEVQPVSGAPQRERNWEEIGSSRGYHSYETQRAHDATHRSTRPSAHPPESFRSDAGPPSVSLDPESVTEAGSVTRVESSAHESLNSFEPFRVMEPVRKKSEPPDAADSVVIRRSQRLEQKAKLAQRLLQQLPENDRRRRLLHAAIMRRDEVLLDGFIAELGG